MPKGGYQKPSNPAPVSNPGSLSRRTDGGPAQVTQEMTGAAYGENSDFNEMQSSAPLRATPGAAMLNPKTSLPTGGGSSSAMPVGMFTPTNRPDEPITSGSPFGPGVGPMTSSVKRPNPTMSDSLQMAADLMGDRSLSAAAERFRLMGR